MQHFMYILNLFLLSFGFSSCCFFVLPWFVLKCMARSNKQISQRALTSDGNKGACRKLKKNIRFCSQLRYFVNKLNVENYVIRYSERSWNYYYSRKQNMMLNIFSIAMLWGVTYGLQNISLKYPRKKKVNALIKVGIGTC